MKKILVAMSHALTQAQIEDLQNNGFEPLVSQLYGKLGCNSLAPTLTSVDLQEIATTLVNEAIEEGCEAIAMTGEPALTFWVWRIAESMKLEVWQSTTERRTNEAVQSDGTVLKTQIFCHVQWRRII